MRKVLALIVAPLALVGIMAACGPVPDPDQTHPAAGLWLSADEVAALPAVPSYIVSAAAPTLNNSDGAEVICGNNLNHSQNVLAAAIVAVKNNSSTYRNAVKAAIQDVVNSQDDSSCDDTRQLGISRKLPGYVWAADLINLKVLDSFTNAIFTDWVWTLLNNNSGEQECGSSSSLGGLGIIGCHVYRSNNWGFVAGVARIVGDSYIAFADPDQADRDRSVADLTTRTDRANALAVTKGQFDTSFYNGFGDRSNPEPHACNPTTFITNGAPVNPYPCDPPPSGGIDWNGGIPEDLDRGTDPSIAGTCSGTPDVHAFGAGNYATGEIYALWRYFKIKGDNTAADNIKNHAFVGGARVLGFFDRLRSSCGATGNYPEGDDQPWPFLVNKLYGSTYPTGQADAQGKVYSFTNYLPDLSGQ